MEISEGEMSDAKRELTIEDLKTAKFHGPIAFYDGKKGWARQDFEWPDNPRFGYAWQRETSKDQGQTFYLADGKRVDDIEEVLAILKMPPDPESPREKKLAYFKKREPTINGCHVLPSEARCNADTGPFGPVRAVLQRVQHAWHVGINRFSDAERKAGRDCPHWLYDAKGAAQETFRLMYLWLRERQQDTDVICALGVRCRDCPILQNIEQALNEERARDFRTIEDSDIDMVKTFTCINHMLQDDRRISFGEGCLHTRDDREDAAYEIERWANIG